MFLVNPLFIFVMFCLVFFVLFCLFLFFFIYVITTGMSMQADQNF